MTIVVVRQREGIAKAKTEGKYTGRKPDHQRRASVAALLNAGTSYTDIIKTLGCSRHLVASVSQELKGVGTFELIRLRCARY